MASATARAPQPGNEKGRPGRRPLPKLYLSISDATDSATDLRLQRLFGIGIIGIRADLIASLAWGATS